MKYLKTYEQNNNSPKVGDFVIVNSSKFDDLKNFFDNEIGTIDSMNETELKANGFPYYVKFNKNIPASTLGPGDEDTIALREIEMLAWSDNLDELKIIIDTKKYNL